MKSTTFKEVQGFRQWWLWLLLLGICLLPIFGIYKQLILGETFGTNPMSDTGLLLFAVFVFLFCALFYFMRLTTTMDEEKIHIRFFPFLEKKIAWQDIQSANIVDYGFVGYGIRIGTRYGTVYNTNGSKGLAIRTKAGKKLCIGTQNVKGLAAWMAQRKPSTF